MAAILCKSKYVSGFETPAKRGAIRVEAGIAECLDRQSNNFLSGILDFPEEPSRNIVDKAANDDGFSYPGVGEKLLQLVTDILFNVLECVEKCRSNGGGSGAILNSAP